MRKRWLWFLAPIALLAFIVVGGSAVMYLWNWLAPALFGFRLITFWQALGLLALCRILFGGWGAGKRGGGRGWKHRADWQQMTPEEREAFRSRMRSRCGSFGPDTGEAEEPA